MTHTAQEGTDLVTNAKKSKSRTGLFRRPNEDDIVAVASLCRRSLREELTEHEIRAALHDEHQDVWLGGDSQEGVVAITRAGDDGNVGFIRLLVVDPSVRRRGIGSHLLRLVEEELCDVDEISVGADAPHYLFPGVDTRDFDLMCLLEKHRYRRKEANLNLRLTLATLQDIPSDGVALAAERDRDAVLTFAETHWPRFRDELPRALRNGTLVIAEDELGLAGFCAHSVGRRAWIGPAAVRPDLLGQGIGRSLVAGAAHDIHRLGWQDHMQIEWVGPLRPYASIGATLEATYIAYRKDLSAVHPIDARRQYAQEGDRS